MTRTTRYVNSSKPTRSKTLCRSGRFAVRMATVMLTMSGTVARRVSRPTTRAVPHRSSLYPTRMAWKCGAGMPSEVKKPVTFSMLWTLPQPVDMKTRPTARRPSSGASQ